MKIEEPTPGSKEAINKGCTCPVDDNCRGKGIPMTNDQGEIVVAFWMSGDCPLHGIKTPKE